MSVMSLYDVWPQDDRPLTVADLERQPHDGNRYELVDGVLEVTPAPLNDHNWFAHRLEYLLEALCPEGLDVTGPVGINLAKDHHRIPDLSVVRSALREPKFTTRPPELVVEVAPRSTRTKDRTTKKREDAAFGIASYWIGIPDVDHPSLTAFELCDGDYELVLSTRHNSTCSSTRTTRRLPPPPSPLTTRSSRSKRRFRSQSCPGFSSSPVTPGRRDADQHRGRG